MNFLVSFRLRVSAVKVSVMIATIIIGVHEGNSGTTQTFDSVILNEDSHVVR